MSKGKEVMVFGIGQLAYLGKRKDNIIVGRMISDIGRVDQDSFAEYLKDKNVDELLQVEVGASTDVTFRKLTRRESIDFDTVKREWSEAVDMAESEIVNQVFDKFRGKG